MHGKPVITYLRGLQYKLPNSFLLLPKRGNMAGIINLLLKQVTQKGIKAITAKTAMQVMSTYTHCFCGNSVFSSIEYSIPY